jgi:hypothetical protein
MNALWEILSTLPDTGPSAPGSHTFAVVLEALKDALLSEDLPDEERADLMDSTIEIWRIVVERWCTGHITLDSHLVTVMTKIMGSSDDPRYLQGAFDLLEQTMNVPKPVVYDIKDSPSDKSVVSAPSLFPSVISRSADPRLSNGIQLVQPTNHILTAFLKIVQKQNRADIATHYWDLLTDSHSKRLTPDNAALKVYLNILASANQHDAILTTIESYAARAGIPDWGTYRIAMSSLTTLRPCKNASAPALKLYKHRRARHSETDMKVVEAVVSRTILATSNPAQRMEWLQMLAVDAASTLDKPTLGWALELPAMKTAGVKIEHELAWRQKWRKRSWKVVLAIIEHIEVVMGAKKAPRKSGMNDAQLEEVKKALEEAKGPLERFVAEVEREMLLEVKMWKARREMRETDDSQ